MPVRGMKTYNIEKYEDIDFEIMNEGDILQIENFEDIADDAKQVTDIMRKMSVKNIRLKFVGFKCEVEPDLILSLFKVYEHLHYKDLRERQYIGIKKALEMKKEGRGSYGRPKAELPDDFEERVITCIGQGCSLSSYRKEINIPQSTFYKYANRIIRKRTCK